MTPEGATKNLICSYLSKVGLFFFIHDSVGIFNRKANAYMSNKSPYRIKGVSDILGILPDGRLFAIEVKAGKNTATPEQKEFIKQINDRGGVAFVARSIDDVKFNLENIFHE